MAPRISPRGFPPNLLRVNPLAALVVVPDAMREDSGEMTRFNKVAEAVKRTLRGQEREEINRAEYRAHKDVLFLFFLHQQVMASCSRRTGPIGVGVCC